MKKTSYYLYIIIFFMLCLLPTVGLVVVGPSQPAANESLPDKPVLRQEEGRANIHFLEDLSDYLDHRFAFRQEMITLNRMVTGKFLKDSTEEDVILGKDGWLFYAETLDDYEGLSPMSDREIWSAAHSLAIIQKVCQAQDVDFLFVSPPNKNSLYGAYMPDRFPARQGSSDLERLMTAMDQEGVAYVDLLTPFQEQEDILYRRYDSHWTSRGAGLAGDLILSALGMDTEPFFGGSYSSVWEEKGDLYEMLYPAGRENDRDERFDKGFTFTYDKPVRSSEDLTILTSCEGKPGSLLMFRDSFGNALHEFMAEGFGKACFSRQSPYDLSMLQRAEADTLVIELVERNLSYLCDCPALFPAPAVRDLPATEPLPGLGAEGTYISESIDSWPGYLNVSGEIAEVGIDLDSPIYLRWGGVLYEALPTGEDSFSACLPEGPAGQSFHLLLSIQGRMVESDALTLS